MSWVYHEKSGELRQDGRVVAALFEQGRALVGSPEQAHARGLFLAMAANAAEAQNKQ